MSQIVDDPAKPLEAGRDAFARHDWARALELLRAAEEAGPLDPEDLERLAEAAWWSRQLDNTIRYRERAYSGYLKQGRKAEAASSALSLVLDYVGKLKMTLATGSLRRAQRLLADEPEGPVHAQLAAIEGMLASDQGDLDRAMELGQRARQIAQRFGAPDLEVLGLLVEGSTRVAMGEVEEGLELLDEATSAAVGGGVSPLSTGFAYCATISTCGSLADYQRAGEWTEAAELWCEQEQIVGGFPGICRVHRAEVKRIRGDWSEAEEEASRAAEELMNFSEDVVGAAYYEIGEVRLRRGDLEGAEKAFASAHEYMHPAQPGMALLLLAQGRVDAAAASIRRSLEEAPHDLARGKLLPAQVTIALAAGDLETARGAAAALEGVAEQYRSPSPALRAMAASARAEVLLADGNADSALACLRAAITDWRAVGAPYEIARMRLLLAKAYEDLDDAEAARVELASAQAAFNKLGAIPDANSAAEWLAELTGRTETVTRTFLFTDVVGSTEFIRRIGDETWSGLLRKHNNALEALFREHRGEKVDEAGDGFFVVFTEADDALTCARAIQRTIADSARFGELRVRIGIHTATAVHDGNSYRGEGVHAAARIAGLAGAGQILASAATLTAAGVTGEERRMVDLEGIDEPVEVAQVSWA